MTMQQKLYYGLYRIRMFELAVAKEYKKQEMRCPVHLSIGQESAAVAIGDVLTKQDLMVSTHRAHAHYLAKGGSMVKLLAELYGKVGGCARGQGGSMHLVDRECGFYGGTSIVGGTIPVGVGLAFGKKLKGEKDVVVVCLGDAALEQGVFHESANFAALHKLRVLFLVENNFYSCYTPISNRQPNRSLKDVAMAHDLIPFAFDGSTPDVLRTHLADIVSEMKDPVASSCWPMFVVVDTYRHVEHCGPNQDDHLNYRPEAEVKLWLKKDPLEHLRVQLLLGLVCKSDWFEEINQKIGEEIETAFEFVRRMEYPSQSELGAYEYASN